MSITTEVTERTLVDIGAILHRRGGAIRFTRVVDDQIEYVVLSDAEIDVINTRLVCHTELRLTAGSCGILFGVPNEFNASDAYVELLVEETLTQLVRLAERHHLFGGANITIARPHILVLV